MICENCHHEREEGGEYRFYYGKNDRFKPFWSKPDHIVGDASAWICKDCLNRYRLITSLAATFLGTLGVVEMIHLALLGNVVIRMVIFGTLAAVTVVLIFWIVLGTRQEIGERLAIHARKAGLKEQGYNAFLTTLARSRYP